MFVDYDDRVTLAEKQEAVRAALADLLKTQSLTEAHEFVVTLLAKLGGAA